MEVQHRFFSIPQDDQRLVQLAWSRVIGALPEEWQCLRGFLEAPPELLAQGRVAENTGLMIDSHGEVRLVRNQRPGPYRPAGVLLEGKLPQTVSFRAVGLHLHPEAVTEARYILQELVAEGFRGRVSLYRNITSSWQEYTAQCNLALQAWEATAQDEPERGPQPARVRVEWQAEHGGRLEHVALIIQACLEHGFHEYTPARHEAAVS